MNLRTVSLLYLLLSFSLTACTDSGEGDDTPVEPDVTADGSTDAAPDAEDVGDDIAVDSESDPDASPDDAGPPDFPFSEGPYGTAFRDLAGPFTLETDAGPWSFEDAWTGRESFIFMVYTNDPLRPQNIRDFLGNYWFPGGSATEEIRELVLISPPDVHYFWMSLDGDAAVDVGRMKEDVDAALSDLDESTRLHWQEHMHYVTERSTELDGWIADFVRETGRLWFAIDMFQRVRQLGMTTDILTDSTRLHLIGHEAVYFSFERRRAEALAAFDFTRVRLFDDVSVRNERVWGDLPPEEEMATYDTLYVDLSAFCPEHLDENCHEWDRNSNLTICDVPVVEENAYADQACQPRVPAVVEVVEVLGSCRVPVECVEVADCEEGVEACIGYVAAGEDTDEVPGTCVPIETDGVCATVDDCDEGEECLGYVAPVAPADEIPAETIACECETPTGETIESTHVCNGDGTGLGDCRCGCPHEVAGWITTYHREGRWVTDITPMLATMQRGGRLQFNLDAGERLDVTLDLLFANSGVGERPREYHFLQGGGRFDENYNDGREVYRFTPPEWATRAEIVAFTTGHGFAQAAGNCAEFCNHTHHWEVNDRVEFLQQFPEADQVDACLRSVDQGVIPNQFGTWPFGRSGWCPGWDVKPWRADITESLRDGENTLRYQGLYRGRPYEPEAAGGNIRMWSYLVYYGP